MHCNGGEKTFPLLRLPREVRDMIYRAAIRTAPPFDWDNVQLLHLDRSNVTRGRPRSHASHAFRMSTMNFSTLRAIQPLPAAINLRLTCRQVNAELRKVYYSTSRPRSLEDNAWHVDIFFNHSDWLRLGPVVYWRSLPCPMSMVKTLAVDIWLDYKDCWNKQINGIVPINYVRGILFELYNMLVYHGPSFLVRNSSRPRIHFDLVDLHEREGIPDVTSAARSRQTGTRLPPVRALQSTHIEPTHLLNLERASSPVSVTAGLSFASNDHREEFSALRCAFTTITVAGSAPVTGDAYVSIIDMVTRYRGRRKLDLSGNMYAQGGMFAYPDPYLEDYVYSGIFKKEVHWLRTSSSIYPADGGRYCVKNLQDLGIELTRSGYFRWLTRSIGLRFRRGLIAYRSSELRKRKYDQISTINE